MKSKLLSRLLIGLFAVSLIGPALAAEIKGTITKVENEGRSITVKGGDGKEVTLSVSGSRTELAGVKDRSDLKKGQKATVTYDGSSASKINVGK